MKRYYWMVLMITCRCLMMYVRTYVCMYVLIITGVQASGVIIDRLLRQCCFVWSEIVGPHSSGNFNDQWLLLKPELLWLLIVNALQLNELSALRNTFYPEYKYVCMYVWCLIFEPFSRVLVCCIIHIKCTVSWIIIHY